MDYKLLYYVVPSESFEAEDRVFLKDEKYPVYDKKGHSLLIAENGDFLFTNELMQQAIKSWELTVIES